MTVKLPSALVLLAAFCNATCCGLSAAQAVPLPRPRPAQTSIPGPAPEGVAEEAATPSACRLRLTAELAVAPSLPALPIRDVLAFVWFARYPTPDAPQPDLAVLRDAILGDPEIHRLAHTT